MYEHSGILIAALLFLALVLAIEIGYRVGRAAESSESTRTHVNVLQAALLGMLALLLGFSFSLALQRYESRSVALIDEANAIGTAYLRIDLLPPALQPALRQQFRDYLALRLESRAVTMADPLQRAALLTRSDTVLDALWNSAAQAVREDPRPVTAGLFVPAVNELIDNYAKRNATLERHVPELVMWLLFGTFGFSGAVVGYAAGLGRHRASFATYMMVGLIVLVVFMIIDLDRPRRGFIRIDQTTLADLEKAMQTETPPAQ